MTFENVILGVAGAYITLGVGCIVRSLGYKAGQEKAYEGLRDGVLAIEASVDAVIEEAYQLGCSTTIKAAAQAAADIIVDQFDNERENAYDDGWMDGVGAERLARKIRKEAKREGKRKPKKLKGKKALVQLSYVGVADVIGHVPGLEPRPASSQRENPYLPADYLARLESIVDGKLHAVIVRYLSEANFYEMREELVFADGYDHSNATRIERIERPVLTAEDAHKEGQYYLAKSPFGFFGDLG